MRLVLLFSRPDNHEQNIRNEGSELLEAVERGEIQRLILALLSVTPNLKSAVAAATGWFTSASIAR